MPNQSLYADPIPVAAASECAWYQTFEFPDGEIVHGRWDYRDNIDDYLGNVDFAGKRVIEIGPASGYLTVAMEQRGAEVVSVDTSDEEIWDFVPRLDRDLDGFIEDRRQGITALRKSWWYAQQKTGGTARIAYCGGHNVSDAFGEFDIGVFASILQHLKNPYEVLSRVARRAKTVIVSEQYAPRLENGLPLAEFIPGPDNDAMESFWRLSSHAVDRMMGTFGFERTKASRNDFKRYNFETRDIATDSFMEFDFFTHVYEKT